MIRFMFLSNSFVMYLFSISYAPSISAEQDYLFRTKVRGLENLLLESSESLLTYYSFSYMVNYMSN
ncbi:hypothetical protein JCM10914A_51730 [Paenibacillus sp. JCM 10914]